MNHDQNRTQEPQPFIPYWLNEAGLSQSQFRLYCYLASRAGWKSRVCWPEISTILLECRMAKGTFRKALNALEAKGLVIRLPKPFGGSNRYRVFSQSGSDEAPCTPSQSDQSPTYQPDQSATLKKVQMEGGESTSSNIQKKRERESAEREREQDGDSLFSFSLPHGKEFEEAWTSWRQHRVEMERPLDTETSTSLLRRLGNYDEDEAVSTLQYTIEMGGTGLRYSAPAWFRAKEKTDRNNLEHP